MRKLSSNPNVITSDVNYPNGRIRNNTGAGNGTPVNESVYGDMHVNKDKLLDLYGIVANNLPDNEANGYQFIEALRALAGKNDFVLPLSLNTGVLNVPIKFGFMLDNEQVICKAGFNLGSETQIKGSDNVTLSFTAEGSFKANEYVRLIKNTSSITLVRLSDDISLDAMITELLYLKKASQAEENAGAIDTKATTPLVNLVAFIRRVNGVDSASYLATSIRNGIYPLTHFNIVASFANIKNVGTFSGYDTGMGPSGTALTTSGDISSAVIQVSAQSDNSIILCTMANAMTNTNYKVIIDVESIGNILFDNDCGQFVFKPISTTQFQISNYKASANLQSLKVHLEVKQL